MVDVKHLLSMQYSAVDLRLDALEDLLRGPDHLHRTIRTKLPEIRSKRAEYDDARVTDNVSSFPSVRRVKPPKKGIKPASPKSLVDGLSKALTGAARQVRETRPGALEHPEAVVAAMDARWWRLSQLDSAIVSSADGSGASWYKRKPEKFRKMLGRSLWLHKELLAKWDELSQQYSRALPEFTSPQTWEGTFEAMTDKSIEEVKPTP